MPILMAMMRPKVLEHATRVLQGSQSCRPCQQVDDADIVRAGPATMTAQLVTCLSTIIVATLSIQQ